MKIFSFLFFKDTLDDIEKEVTERHPKRKVWHYIFSPLYLVHLVWFCMLTMGINTFYGTMMPWLEDIYPNDTHKGTFCLNFECLLF